jgi:hypothetical protein
MSAKPNLGLIVEITTAEGTRYQWGKGSNSPADVPQGLTFSTRLGDGFADASVTLHRRIDRDWPDINLYDDVALIGMDGSVAYEGRVAANPRSISTAHSMNVVCAGWMAHTRDRKMIEVYVDRNSSSWTDPPLSRRVAAVIAGESSALITADSSHGLSWTVPDQALPANTSTELYYTAPPGCLIVQAQFVGTRNGAFTSFEGPTLFGNSTEDLTGGSLEAVGMTLDGNLQASTFSAAQRYVMIRAKTTGAVTPASAWLQSLSTIAVYGTALTQRAQSPDPPGFYASDIIRDVVGRFCPLLNTNGVQDTTYIIPQAAYLDPTDPFDVIADVNKYHRWQFYVWENKTFTYAPIDLSDYDWAIDYFDPGVTLDLQGDSTDDGAFNGICVNFTDLGTGKPNRLTPDTNSELADTDPENPANRRGIDHWDEISLSSPTTSDGAIQIGRAALAEKNTPKGQGTITIQGHVKDRAGHWQQGWKVRAGDRVAIVSSTSLSDRPRLISETSWDNDSKTLSITVESPPARLDAVLDRIQTALSAAGLS